MNVSESLDGTRRLHLRVVAQLDLAAVSKLAKPPILVAEVYVAARHVDDGISEGIVGVQGASIDVEVFTRSDPVRGRADVAILASHRRVGPVTLIPAPFENLNSYLVMQSRDGREKTYIPSNLPRPPDRRCVNLGIVLR